MIPSSTVIVSIGFALDSAMCNVVKNDIKTLYIIGTGKFTVDDSDWEMSVGGGGVFGLYLTRSLFQYGELHFLLLQFFGDSLRLYQM